MTANIRKDPETKELSIAAQLKEVIVGIIQLYNIVISYIGYFRISVSRKLSKVLTDELTSLRGCKHICTADATVTLDDFKASGGHDSIGRLSNTIL